MEKLKLVACFLLFLGVYVKDRVNGQLPDAIVQPGLPDETSILKMGRQFRNPLLRLLGTAMRNSKMDVLGKVCSLNRCGEWSLWSPCPVETKGQFGMTTRSRQCGKGPSFCQFNISRKISVEVDSKVCMGVNCPPGFTKTDNGFCFLLHDTGMCRDDAGKFCEGQNSFVVNPVSKLRSDDLHNFLRTQGKTSETIWLDARRKDLVSPWEYSYFVVADNYTNWKSGQPNQDPNELCMVEEDIKRKWFDRVCNTNYIVVCEFL